MNCSILAGLERRGRRHRAAAHSLHAREGLTSVSVTYSAGRPVASGAHPGLEKCSPISCYRACYIPKRIVSVFFLTCNDSSSFTSSFGGNKSLAWMYSKLGGPSSPCITNKTHIKRQTPASACYEKAKSRVMDTLGTPVRWGSPEPVDGNACSASRPNVLSDAAGPQRFLLLLQNTIAQQKADTGLQICLFQPCALWKAEQIHLNDAQHLGVM